MIKKLLNLGFLISLLLWCSIGAFNFLIPNEISLIVGQKQQFSYNIPIKVDLYNKENLLVSGSSDMKVTDNINFDYGETKEIIPREEGTIKAHVSAFGIPIKEVSLNIIPNEKVIPCGEIIGISMETQGVLVLGTGSVKDYTGLETNPAEGKLETGDIIIQCNSKTINSKEDLMEAINHTSNQTVNLQVIRNDEKIEIEILPTKISGDNLKIGAWIRDSTQGLGTITFIDEELNFGALGHGIYDVDAGVLMPFSSGSLFISNITGINKGLDGAPGEVKGNLRKDVTIGDVSGNNNQGIYGTIKENGIEELNVQLEPVEIALKHQVEEGEAVIYSSILGNGVEEFKVEIEDVNRFSVGDKGFVVKITDNRLLSITGGIVQGMSGSPIIQDGKLIGAVTHVFVNDPTRGYGIFIESMIESVENIIE